jgi:predicted membrane channel-forming protein YqfA (hemolysin III family)
MLHSALQVLFGCLLLLGGAALYTQHGGFGPLVLLVMGAILLSVGAVLMGVRQILREESNRREQASKPVLNI